MRPGLQVCSDKITSDNSATTHKSNTTAVAPSHREVAAWKEKNAIIPTLKTAVKKATSVEEDAAEHGTEGQECLGEGLGTSTTVHRGWTSPGAVPW